MKISVIGLGATGARAARQIASSPDAEYDQVWDEISLWDHTKAKSVATAESLGGVARPATNLEAALDGSNVVVLCLPGSHKEIASKAVSGGGDVISTASNSVVAMELLDMDALARQHRRHIVVGAGFSPGLSGLLAKHFAATFDEVNEVHFAVAGAGGPACRGEQANSMRHGGRDWIDNRWHEQNNFGGSVQRWFPDPIGSRECMACSGAEVLLVLETHPELSRATLRVARRKRTMAGAACAFGHSALLSKFGLFKQEDSLGGLAVEIKGKRGQTQDVVLAGAVDRPALAAGTVAAVTAMWSVQDQLAKFGSASLASMINETVPFLHALAARGVRAAVFESSSALQIATE